MSQFKDLCVQCGLYSIHVRYNNYPADQAHCARYNFNAKKIHHKIGHHILKVEGLGVIKMEKLNFFTVINWGFFQNLDILMNFLLIYKLYKYFFSQKELSVTFWSAFNQLSTLKNISLTF